jgi:hypothetical protein
MQHRRRFKQQTTLEERLADEARRLRDRARQMPPGPEREALLRKARHDEMTSQLSEWLTSPGRPMQLQHVPFAEEMEHAEEPPSGSSTRRRSFRI